MSILLFPIRPLLLLLLLLEVNFSYFVLFIFLHSQRLKKARQDIQIETLSQLIKGDNIIIFIIIALPVDIKIYNEYSSVERLFRAHLIVRFCIMQTLFFILFFWLIVFIVVDGGGAIMRVYPPLCMQQRRRRRRPPAAVNLPPLASRFDSNDVFDSF